MDKIKLDLKGVSFDFPTFYLENKEFSKITHEINNLYYSKYANKKFAVHRSLDLTGNYCLYYFENHGYDDYNIVNKESD